MPSSSGLETSQFADWRGDYGTQTVEHNIENAAAFRKQAASLFRITMTYSTKLIVATVTAVRSFGIFVKHGKNTILVHLSELSWVFPYNPLNHFEIGQSITIVPFEEFRVGQAAKGASVRRVSHPNLPGGLQEIGRRLSATVTKVSAADASVLVGNDLVADIPLSRLKTLLDIQQTIELVVEDLAPWGGAFLRYATSGTRD